MSKILLKYLDILACPDCGGDLKINKNNLVCSSCRSRFPVVLDIPVLLPSNILREQLKAIEVWGAEYRDLIKNKQFNYSDKYCEADIDLIKKNPTFNKGSFFLEVGCGRARNCCALIEDGYRNVIGLDISLDALTLAKKICDYHNLKGGFFVVGDIYNIPFKKDVFDLIFGGGSLEHFEDTYGGFVKLRKVMKIGGQVIATVPYVSISTLLQAFLTGNIPNIPVIRDVYAFFHKYIARDQNLMYGFEYSFTISNLRKMSALAGFKKFNYNFYDVDYDLKFIPIFRKFFLWLIRKPLFWPMIVLKLDK